MQFDRLLLKRQWQAPHICASDSFVEFTCFYWSLLYRPTSLSLLQVGLNLLGEVSTTRVLRLHSALFSSSFRSTSKSSMLYFTTSKYAEPASVFPYSVVHVRLPPRFSWLTQSSFSRRCTCPNHLNLASRSLSVMHATPRMLRISSFLFLSLNVMQRIHLSILISVFSKRSSLRLINVHVSKP